MFGEKFVYSNFTFLLLEIKKKIYISERNGTMLNCNHMVLVRVNVLCQVVKADFYQGHNFFPSCCADYHENLLAVTQTEVSP